MSTLISWCYQNWRRVPKHSDCPTGC